MNASLETETIFYEGPNYRITVQDGRLGAWIRSRGVWVAAGERGSVQGDFELLNALEDMVMARVRSG